MSSSNDIVIYQNANAKVEVQVQVNEDSVWLTQAQMTELFERDRTVITRHINNVFKEGELDEKSNVQILHISGSDRPVKYYNLDVIISVGYRVKSKQGTQFRIWANRVLKEYLVKGYALNEKRLQESEARYNELLKTIEIVSQVADTKALTSGEAKGILQVLEKYAHALDLLDKYDHQNLSIDAAATTEVRKLTYGEAKEQIGIWKEAQNAGALFGNEKDTSFKSSLDNIYQTFDDVELYPTIEEKAANLLYFIVKNHSFTDGNKRIAAGLFVYFLDLNNKLYKPTGSKKIGDNALVAITIMIAESQPDDKDIMIKLVVNLMNG